MDGQTPALTAEQAALRPFYGTYPAVYEPAKDPWRQPEVGACACVCTDRKHHAGQRMLPVGPCAPVHLDV